MTTMKSAIFYLLSCAFILSIEAALINKCTKGGVVPDEVVIDGCEPDETVCTVQFDGIFNMTMKFEVPHYLESMKTILTGKTVLGSFSLSAELPTEQICEGILNTFCPLVEKEQIEYRYSTKLLVLPFLPISMEFEIFDVALNETTICFNVAVNPINEE